MELVGAQLGYRYELCIAVQLGEWLEQWNWWIDSPNWNKINLTGREAATKLDCLKLELSATA